MGNASSNPDDYKGKTIFDYEAPTLDDKTVSLSEYKGKKAYLVVNVASHCGLTNGNYKELNDLYNLHKDDGLEILAFPSDNFGGQEFQDNNKIKEFTCSAKVYNNHKLLIMIILTITILIIRSMLSFQSLAVFMLRMVIRLYLYFNI